MHIQIINSDIISANEALDALANFHLPTKKLYSVHIAQPMSFWMNTEGEHIILRSKEKQTN